MMDRSFARGLGIGLVALPVVDFMRGLPLIGRSMLMIFVVAGLVLLVWSFIRR